MHLYGHNDERPAGSVEGPDMTTPPRFIGLAQQLRDGHQPI